MMTQLSERSRRGFLARIETRGADDCWPWKGARTLQGYGRFTYRSCGVIKAIGAHRLSFELFHGEPVGEGLDCCHSCDNPWCVNPRHLFAGTRAQNMRDAVIKGRTSNTPHAKRTDSDPAKRSHADRKRRKYHQDPERERARKRAEYAADRDAQKARKLAAYHAKKEGK